MRYKIVYDRPGVYTDEILEIYGRKRQETAAGEEET